MSIIETLAIFVAIPAVVIAVVVGLIFAGGNAQSRRYRPGRQFDFTPVWFLAAPATAAPAKSGRHAVRGAGPILALAKGSAVEPAEASAPDLTGGTSERW